jgi:hypothetical protein
VPKLSNHLLREKSIKEFLTAMGVDITGVRVSSIGELFHFSFDDPGVADCFANGLNTVIQADSEKKPVKSLSLAEIIGSEIEHATSTDSKLAVHQASCEALLAIIESQRTNFVFSQESDLLELTLPNPAYAAMFNLLEYPHITFSTDGRLIFNIKKYLQNTHDAVVKITGFDFNQPPLFFLNSNILKEQKIYYATKELGDGNVEVTPYFFVPRSITPPIYHFVLDVSGSMENALPDLKRSVKSLAQQLFMFQPDAELTITTFSNGVDRIGSYKFSQLKLLNVQIDDLVVKSDTPLYEVTAHFLEVIADDTMQNNVLLFTDGQESGSKPNSESRVRAKIDNSGANEPLISQVRNKFYIFSYHVGQDSLMREVAKVFGSEVVETSSADFVAALDDSELLMKWAAARDLFSMHLVVVDKQGIKSTEQYRQSLDMSGQFTSLKPRICQSGETIEISVFDGSGNPVLQSSKFLIETQFLPEFLESSQIQDVSVPEQSELLDSEISAEILMLAQDKHAFDKSYAIPRFFLDCVDHCISLASDYARGVVRDCPSYFPPQRSNYWQRNGQVFFTKTGLPGDYSHCSLQQIAGPSTIPQLGFTNS